MSKPDDICKDCGLARREHHYNGAAYGVCGQFSEIAHRSQPGTLEREEVARMTDKSIGGGARVHFLKTWPEYFEAILTGQKTFEWRIDDRDFRVGDTLVLQEYVPNPENAGREGHYTGRDITKKVTYLFGCWATNKRTVVMSLAPEAGTQNPCNKIFDYKWLDPNCVENGCQSLVLAADIKRYSDLAGDFGAELLAKAGTQGLLEATAAQHFDLPKGQPAKFVRNGVLETCQCRECAPKAGTQEPVGWQWRAFIAGHWGAWMFTEDVEKLKNGDWAFNFENGTAQARALYAAPQPASVTQAKLDARPSD